MKLRSLLVLSIALLPFSAKAKNISFAELGSPNKRHCVESVEMLDTITKGDVTIVPTMLTSICYEISSGEVAGISTNEAEITNTGSSKALINFFYSIGDSEKECKERLKSFLTRKSGAVSVGGTATVTRGLVATQDGVNLKYDGEEYVCIKI